MCRRPPRSTLLTHAFPTRRSSDLAEADDADFRGGFLRGWAGHGRGLYAGRTGFSSRLWPVGPGGGQAASTWRSDIRVRTMRPSREISRMARLPSTADRKSVV